MKLHVALAFLNVLGAAVGGILLAVHKVSPFLPGHVLSNVYAHAHLAALGWATMMVMGVGYRMLPMMLPAAMPRGVAPYASALLLEAGTIGLVACLLLQSRALGLFALIALSGLLTFLSQVAWLRRHRRPAATELRRPDYGVENRLLPLASWLRGFADRGFARRPPPLHAMADRRLQGTVLALWTAGVPLLAAGLYTTCPRWVAGGGGALLVAVRLGTTGHALVLRAARLEPAEAE